MPVFNLERAIYANIEQVHNLLKGRLPFEIVPVDDGSSDQSAAELRRAVTRFPESVRPVYIDVNGGKGAALVRGFEHSRGSHVLLLDGDLDLDPRFVGRFFDVMLNQQAAIVIGSKRHAESEVDYPWRRRVTSWVYYTLVKLLVGLPITDTQTGMKLFQREALHWALDRMLVKRFAFDLEVLAIAHQHGFRVREAPIRMHFGDKRGCLTWANVRTVMLDTLAIFYRLRVLRYYQNVTPCQLPDPPPRVSIVIACPAPSVYLTEALNATARQTYRNFEVLVLPDSATPEYAWPPGVQVIPTGPLRPAEKRNIGIAHASGTIVAFLDDDAFPVVDWLQRAVAYFSAPRIAAVGGPAITPPSDPRMAQLGGRVYASPLVSGNCRYRYASERVRDVDDFPSCNLLVRTSTLRELGGFRTDFWPGEDTILCAEIVHRLGQRIVYDPWTVVYHHRRPLFGPHLRQVGRYARHRGYFARRFPKTSRRIAYMIPPLFVVGLSLGAALACLNATLRTLYLASVASYLVLTLLATVHTSLRTWLLTWLGVVSTHIVYGARFIQGACARRMPGTVRPFDHPSETATGATPASHGDPA